MCAIIPLKKIGTHFKRLVQYLHSSGKLHNCATLLYMGNYFLQGTIVYQIVISLELTKTADNFMSVKAHDHVAESLELCSSRTWFAPLFQILAWFFVTPAKVRVKK